MSEEKGFLLGLQALKVLIEEGHDIKVRLGGDGPLRQQIESFIAEHRLQDHIEMLGFVDNEQLRRYYRSRRVPVAEHSCGYLGGGQACVVQEAMLMRAVVAVSRTGGVGESTAPSHAAFIASSRAVWKGWWRGLPEAGADRRGTARAGCKVVACRTARYDIECSMPSCSTRLCCRW